MLSIPYVNMPSGAVAPGTAVTIQVAMVSQGYVSAAVRVKLDDVELPSTPVAAFMTPGTEYLFSFSFTMPAHDAVLYMTPEWLDEGTMTIMYENTGMVTVPAQVAANEFNNLVATYA